MGKNSKKQKCIYTKCTHIDKCYDINTFTSFADNVLLFNCKECQLVSQEIVSLEIYICLICRFQGCFEHIQSHSINSDKHIHCLYITLQTYQLPLNKDLVFNIKSSNVQNNNSIKTDHQITDVKYFSIYCTNCKKRMPVLRTFESFINILSPFINKDVLKEYNFKTYNINLNATCQMQIAEDFSRSYIPKGLQNLGNTCFFNSVLQVLCNTSAFIRALMLYNGKLPKYHSEMEGENNEEFSVDKYKDFPLITSAMQVFTSMDNSNCKKSKANTTVNPKGFLNALSKKYPFLEKGAQQDSHEFLLIVLDALREEELKYNGLVSKYLSRNLPTVTPTSEVSNQASPKIEKFSFVNLIFGGQFVSNLTCRGCNHISSTTEPFVDISLPVTTCATNGHPSKGVAKQSAKVLKNKEKGRKSGKPPYKKNETDSDEPSIKVKESPELNGESINSTTSANLSKHQLKKMKKKNKKLLVAGKKLALKKAASSAEDHTINAECCTDGNPSPILQLATRCTNAVLTSVLANLQCLSLAQGPFLPIDNLIRADSEQCEAGGDVENEMEKTRGTLHLNLDSVKDSDGVCNQNTPAFVSFETTPSSSGDSGILNTNESSSYTLDDIRSEGGKESDERSLVMTQSEISEDEVDSAQKGSEENVQEGESVKMSQKFGDLQLCDPTPFVSSPTLAPYIKNINLNSISQQELADILSPKQNNNDAVIKSSNIGSFLIGDKLTIQSEVDVDNEGSKIDEMGNTASMLDTLFANFVRSEILADTGLQCDGCKSKEATFEKSIRIAQAPVVLVVHFKRFLQQTSASQKGCQLSKYSSAITFPEHFDISPYLKFSDGNQHQTPCSYALYGVICHTGSLRSGHYYAYLRTSRDPALPCWSYISDSSVRRNLNFSHISTSDAYLLFYERT